MTDDQKTTPQDAAKGIEDGLTGLFTALGQTFTEMLERLEGAAETTVTRAQKIETSAGPVNAQASVHLRFGGLEATPSGATDVLPQSTQKATETEATALSYQLIEQETAWLFTADIPGVAFHDLAISQDGTVLILQTTGARQYLGRIELHQEFSLDEITISLRSGVLTLQIEKADAP